MTAFVLSLSPRIGGNSDLAATLIGRELGVSPFFLRSFHILPCTGCGKCTASGRCVFSGQDQADELFTRMMDASSLWLCAPVYFYHLPSQAKAWMDRAQSYYMRQQSVLQHSQLERRPARVLLVAGRPKGERLFAGILTSLRCFLDVFGYTLEEELCLRGVDERMALAQDDKLRSEIVRFAAVRA